MSQKDVRFNVEVISQLLRNKSIYIECLNPNYRDFIGRHKTKVETIGSNSEKLIN